MAKKKLRTRNFETCPKYMSNLFLIRWPLAISRKLFLKITRHSNEQERDLLPRITVITEIIILIEIENIN